MRTLRLFLVLVVVWCGVMLLGCGDPTGPRTSRAVLNRAERWDVTVYDGASYFGACLNLPARSGITGTAAEAVAYCSAALHVAD